MPLGIRASAFSKAASATCIAGAIAFGILAGSASASAAPVDCATLGATTIAPGICQIVFTANGTFTPPAGVSALEALLVGGGTAGTADVTVLGYDGGLGAEVLYVDSVSIAAPVTVIVGAGGTTAGVPATGSALVYGASANSAEPAVLSSINGDAGVLPSTLVAAENPASTLFPAFAGEQAVAGDGLDGTVRDPATPGTDWTAAGGGTFGTFANARPNSGAGGGGANFNLNDGSNIAGGNGAAGLVIFRFAAPEAAVSPALAATGTDSTLAIGAAGALLLGGAVALAATGAKRRRTA